MMDGTPPPEAPAIMSQPAGRRRAPRDARPMNRAALTDQILSDADQTSSDADQTASDSDQTAAERDAADARSDQLAAEQDEARARQLHVAAGAPASDSYETATALRAETAVRRLVTQLARNENARSRARTAAERDAIATARDAAAGQRDSRAVAVERSIAGSDAPAEAQLAAIRARAAADRSRAAADRERAAQDRIAAAGDRARLEQALTRAHLDDLTGAFRREIGTLALRQEVARARRADGRFVIAFVDVDGMKEVNDRHGHAAGDYVLQRLVSTIRSRLRSFDPVVRFGGDEFVCGLGGADLDDAERRFQAIDQAVRLDVGVGICVGLAALEPDETLEELTARADAALLEAKKARAG